MKNYFRGLMNVIIYFGIYQDVLWINRRHKEREVINKLHEEMF